MLKQSLIIASIFAVNAFAGEHLHSVKNYELAGVMKNHIHAKNSFMTGYSTQYTSMSGLYNQTETEAENTYMMVSEKMAMQMHMLDLMYGVTDKFNIAVMPQFMSMDMKHFHVDKMSHETHEVSGVGDTKISGIYQIAKPIIGSIGVSLPTGSISNQTGGNQGAYMMQTGTGSYELLPSLTFTEKFHEINFGIQTNASIKLNDNAHNYRFGNSYNFTAWAGKDFNKNLGSHLRVDYINVGKIQGTDLNLDTTKSVMNNPVLQFREITTVLIGGNLYMNNGLKFLIEAGVPIYQNLGQGMLKNSYSIHLSVRKSFN